MKWTSYNCEGREVESGPLETIENVDVPTHGSLSIEIAEGKFLSFKTSEWLMVFLQDSPVTWKTKPA